MRARLVVTRWSLLATSSLRRFPLQLPEPEHLASDPARAARVQAHCWAMADAVALAEIREEREFTRTDVARLLTSPANVSRIERQRDLYLSTLAQYVAALGGTLKVSVVFDDGEVEIGVSADARRRRR